MYKRVIAFVLFIFINHLVFSQSNLNKVMSLDVKQQRIDKVLEILSNRGNFYFSYNSSIVKRDSLVTISEKNKTVKQLLEIIFHQHYEFVESGNYIIIRRAPVNLSINTSPSELADKFYQVSGYVFDEENGDGVGDASIYEKRLLASTLTDARGYFRIRIKSHKQRQAELTVSKEFYKDTSVSVRLDKQQQINITIVPERYTGQLITVSPGDLYISDSIKVKIDIDPNQNKNIALKTYDIKVEETGLSKFLLSSRQKIQSINLRKFFTERPFQLSLTPGLSTMGDLSPQIVTKYSLNVFGGYTGGVNGVEIGGLFNMNKKDVKYFQAGGIFNLVGGSVNGVQLGGINNTVLAGFRGFQAGGINNMVKGSTKGWQIAGIYNHTGDSVTGVQVGGVGNFAGKRVNGVQIVGISNITFREVNGTQIAGIVNWSHQEMNGTQIAGVINYARSMKGVMIGLINIADTIDGYSVGLINIIFKGYHKLSAFSTESQHFNLAFKTGSKRLYNLLQAGMNLNPDEKLYSFGYGLGSENSIIKKWLSVNPELTASYMYAGSWNDFNLLTKFSVNLNFKLGRLFSVFGGPSYNAFYSNRSGPVSGYADLLAPGKLNSHRLNDYITGWMGWNVGINIF